MGVLCPVGPPCIQLELQNLIFCANWHRSSPNLYNLKNRDEYEGLYMDKVYGASGAGRSYKCGLWAGE